ncbi:hypothetical protein LguiA_026650 [Lonicera macranthoides]
MSVLNLSTTSLSDLLTNDSSLPPPPPPPDSPIMRQSVRIVMQCPNQLPSGMIKADDRKLCPPSRCRMQLLIIAIVHRIYLYFRVLKNLPP